MDLPRTAAQRPARLFQPLSSTLVYGQHDAILTEAPLTVDQGTAVGDSVAASGKNLADMFASHAHGDHWFTAGMLADRFDADVVALPGTIEQMQAKVRGAPVLYDKLWPGCSPRPR